jgi:hypothetical protein
MPPDTKSQRGTADNLNKVSIANPMSPERAAFASIVVVVIVAVLVVLWGLFGAPS